MSQADDPSRVRCDVGRRGRVAHAGRRCPTSSCSASEAGARRLTRVLGPRARAAAAPAVQRRRRRPVRVEDDRPGQPLAARGDDMRRRTPGSAAVGRCRLADIASITVFLRERGSAYITAAVVPVDGGVLSAS